MTESELVRWGEALGRDAHPPMLITLVGELGTGKTTLAQAICRGYGVTEEVTSPTYALVHEYTAPKSPVFHIDLYRLESPDELDNMGWEELIQDHALVLVEWPERAGNRLPPIHVPIALDYLADDPTRRVLLAG
jgi:tRNA threonylcarbamoyladenosine biosynthesis protein TsaE